MPFPKTTTYPAAATNQAWQKKKSVLDKNIKTKVGPALVTAQAKWAAIKFADLRIPDKWSTVQAAQAALDKANQAWPAVLAARVALKSAITVTTAQSRNSKLNSASRKALAGLLPLLNDAHNRLEMMDDIIPNLKIDLNITTKEAAEAQRQQQARLADAVKTLTKVQVKAGSTLIFSGGSGKLGSDGTYLIKRGQFAVSHDTMLRNLQKPVKVQADDALGRIFTKDMTLTGVSGSDTVRLK